MARIRGLIYRIICGQWHHQAIYHTLSFSYCGVGRTSSISTTANKFGEGSSRINSIYSCTDLKRWYVQSLLFAIINTDSLQILFLSLVLTILSFLLRPSKSNETFSQRVQTYYKNRKDLPSASRKQFINLATRLPNDVYPLLIILRLPLLVLILRQQLYLHPVPPYTIEDGTMRVLHSEQSLTGQIVVAENIRDGYRFMRCDHSILGGRWTREIPDGKGGMKTDLGDS